MLQSASESQWLPECVRSETMCCALQTASPPSLFCLHAAFLCDSCKYRHQQRPQAHARTHKHTPSMILLHASRGWLVAKVTPHLKGSGNKQPIIELESVVLSERRESRDWSNWSVATAVGEGRESLNGNFW